MPGLPMFGHGQIEGLKEKYGMEYSKAYWDEVPNDYLVNDHYKRIFPLLKLRYLFSGSDYFDIYDLVHNGHVHDSAFCYSNGTSDEKAVVFIITNTKVLKVILNNLLQNLIKRLTSVFLQLLLKI